MSRRRTMVVDLGLWTLATVLAFPLREITLYSQWSWVPVLYALVGLPVKAVALGAFRVGPGSSPSDLFAVAKATLAGSLVLFAIGLLWYAGTESGFPRSVPALEGMAALILLAGFRVWKAR